MSIMIPDEIRETLRNVHCRTPEQTTELRETMRKIKKDAVERREQALAKEVWCLETILFAQQHYLDAFDQMRAGDYYKAWCTLEIVEIQLRVLERHYPLNDYWIEHIATHTRLFQGLYPYSKFLSPGMVVKERRCGLCDAVLTPRTGCQHRKGEIYDGEMCVHQITQADVNHVAIVDDPVEKACVLFFKDQEYDYSLVEYVAQRLGSAFDCWSYEWTRIRQPHVDFADFADSDPCPCESDIPYKDCCLPIPEGVLRPRVVVAFEAPTHKPLDIKFVNSEVPPSCPPNDDGRQGVSATGRAGRLRLGHE